MKTYEPPPSDRDTPENLAGIQLLESQEKLRAFFDSDLVGIVFGDADGNLVEANDEFLRLSGYGREDLGRGLRWSGLGAPEFRHLEAAGAPEAKERSASAPQEKQYLRKDGTRLWVLVRYALLGPQRDRSVAFVLDIDARKRAERALEDLSRSMARRERLLNATLSSTSDFAYTFDREGRFLFANQPLLALWGIPLEQAVGRNFLELGYPPDLAEKLRCQVQSVFETGKTVIDEDTYTSPSGNVGHYEYIFSPAFDAAGQIDFVVGSTRDVSERKASELALRKSVEEFQGLAEAMPQMVWAARPDGWTFYLSPQWTEYSGLTEEESSGHGWIQAFHPDDRERSLEAWQQARSMSGTYVVESRLRRADGCYRWFLIRGVPQRDAAGVIVKWFGTCTDIHDMKLAQLAMAASEARFAKVFHSRLLPIAITEIATGRLVEVNDRFAELFGYSVAEMTGRTSLELGLWADLNERQRHAASLAAGSSSTLETNYRRKSGEIRRALISSDTMAVTDEEPPLSISVLLDLTERQRLESRLLQAQKMEAVGRLAGGVAHDFNNLLGVIMGYTELLLLEASDSQKEELEQVLRASQSAATLTHQLLAFSRSQIVNPQVLDLNLLLSDVQTMLKRLIGEDIDIAIFPGPELGQVKADRGQLEQVVLNLCANARDAMPQGGLLRIETANRTFGEGALAGQDPVAPGSYVMLAVRDSGVGIDPKVLHNIFEPFFTTKELGKGTGLGLAMVHGIVKQSGGYISVESEADRGTDFRIYLPRIDEPAAVAPDLAALPLPRGSETILLVEDENQLRTLVRALLTGNGYQVLPASGASEALAIANRHSGPIDLLITDVVMPGTNGRELAQTLLAGRPETRVLYMSGYTHDVIAHRGVLAEGILLLEKPFTIRALLLRVREALGRREP